MQELRNELSKYEFILGSASPRRKEILETNLGITNVKVLQSDFAEDLPKEELTAIDYVLQTCIKKRDSILQLNKLSKSIILCSDTIIECDSEVLEKPKTETKQREMFDKYRKAGSIRVITAIAITKIVNDLEITKTGFEITTLKFNECLPSSFIEDYINSGEGLNVAGGFKYQEKGCLLFNTIEGDYFNIVGLPVWKTYDLLSQVLKES